MASSAVGKRLFRNSTRSVQSTEQLVKHQKLCFSLIIVECRMASLFFSWRSTAVSANFWLRFQAIENVRIGNKK